MRPFADSRRCPPQVSVRPAQIAWRCIARRCRRRARRYRGPRAGHPPESAHARECVPRRCPASRPPRRWATPDPRRDPAPPKRPEPARSLYPERARPAKKIASFAPRLKRCRRLPQVAHPVTISRGLSVPTTQWMRGADIMQSRSTRFFINVLCALLLLSYAPAFSRDANSTAAQTTGLSLLVLGSGGPGATGRAGSGYIVSLDGRPRILVD